MSNLHYPEHEKLAAVKEDYDAVAAFLGWLQGNGFTICEHQAPKMIRPATTNEKRVAQKAGLEPPEYVEYSLEPRLMPVWLSTYSWLGRYFGISWQKIHEESEALLQTIHEQTK